jgi:alpha-amylase/alpha-mannosidase (GH57 family)
MTHPLYVAFIWHQHQPFYKSPVEGKYRMPWTRLHGIKDYLDMVLRLERYPQLHQTVNLVPSLLLQIEDYVQGRAFDPYLELALLPMEQLSAERQGFVVDRFFDAHFPTLIDPHPRYRELYWQRERQGRDWCLTHWTEEEFGDLLAWHNLAWFDPIFRDDPDIATWLERQRGFTLGDRQRIYAKQQEILGRIVPQHAQMQAQGQLEITTTPYTHPILPLLVDERAARVARPGLPLPRYPFRWEDDVSRHLRKGKQIYEERFGRSPRGLWPSEQSVSPAVLPHIQAEGFEWIVSDEGVLGQSLGLFFHRDELGQVEAAEKLYQAYRLPTEAGDLAIIFRDHRLSDLIGFSYGSMPATAAVEDFIGHLDAIQAQLAEAGASGTGGDRPWLVTVALDGENCWSYYPEDGGPFLDTLYTRLSQHDGLKLVTVSEYLDQFPPTALLPAASLHSGSWIEADFTTWIGDPVKNRAWELLAQARQVIEGHPKADEGAWDAMLAAEGSDWFWWFGEGHSSQHDAFFDELFREHLKSLYRRLDESIPTALNFPLEDHDGTGDRLPQGFIHPTINGVPEEREWTKGGRIEIGGATGTMHRASSVRRLWYGYDHFHLYLRLDFSSALQRPSQLLVFWYYPNLTTLNSPVPLQNLPDRAPFTYHYRHSLQIDLTNLSTQLCQAGELFTWESIPHQVQLALDRCLEIAIPWHDLAIQPGQDAAFAVLTAAGDIFQEALPDRSTIAVRVP